MTQDKALAIVPRTLLEVNSLAEILAASSLIPKELKGRVPDVVVQILAGQELGLAPMASIRGIHIIAGKPVLSADAMVGLVLGSGLCEYFTRVEETETSVTYEAKRKGSPHAVRATWTDADSKAAGLDRKDNYRLHKKQMRMARAKAILARDLFPDVLAGCYEHDEITVPAQHQMPSRREDVEDAEIVSETPVPANDRSDPIARMVDAGRAALDAIPDKPANDATPIADSLDAAFRAYLDAVQTAPDLKALDDAATSPAKPAQGTKNYALAVEVYRARKAELQQSRAS